MIAKSCNCLLQCLLCFAFCVGCCSHELRLSPFSNSTSNLCSHAQSLSLLHLKNSFSIDCSSSSVCGSSSYPKTEYWKEGSDCCSWDGVRCDRATGHVIELDLSCSCLSGTIRPNSTLFSLLEPHLRKLNLAHNNFHSSSVSDGFGRFSSLTHLNLSASGFSGPISPQVSHLSNLVSLDLSRNREAEFITPNGLDSLVQNLTKLRILDLFGVSTSSPVLFPNSLMLNRSSLISLDLSSCGLYGRFPDHGIHLPNLQFLSLSGNSGLSGSFPRFSANNSLMGLDLSSTNFSGEVPASIGNLKSLQGLDLSDCEFSGSIPTSIGNPKFLQILYLSKCQFSGSIPDSLENLTQIVSLLLNDNHFSGDIPHVFHNLADLVWLDLSGNSFNGQLPPSIENLTKLSWLDLSRNQLGGAILCSHVSGFPSLIYVDFGHNMFSGTMPPCWYTLPSLFYIDLSYNKFTGPIRDFQSHSLWDIDLSMNELDGSIPSSVFELVNLTYLSISSNNLSGILETNQLKKLLNLKYLDLSNNKRLSFTCTSNNSNSSMLPGISFLDLSNNNISGTWTWNLGLDTLAYLNLSYNSISGFQMLPWTNLLALDLRSNLLQGSLPIPPNSSFFFSVSHNKLIGEISPLICQVRSIQILDLSYNNLSGMLPYCLGNFSEELSVLNLRRNQFHGVIPYIFLKGNAMRTLDFNDNQFEGLVPRSLIICRELEILNLGNNKINDTFPHWLATLPKLQVLVLHANHFHGDIISFPTVIKSPFASLRILDLAYNDFKGNLPGPYLTSLKGMMKIDESNMTRKYMGDEDNEYQYSTSVTMKGFEVDLVKILETFTTIDLSCNKFQGEIPKCIGNLNSLRGLNLSHNNLTGHIPLSFKNLKMLESLDLSSNKLSGIIPQELTSVTFLEVLNLSYNDLTGVIPRGSQFDTFENDSLGTQDCVDFRCQKDVQQLLKYHILHKTLEQSLKVMNLIGELQY